jgi:putative ATP-dependent endonuclease of the OLD family
MDYFDQIKPTKLGVRNYKSFGNEEQGFEGIEPINLIVGRNNSGKSALLDLIQFLCGNYSFPPSTHNRAGSLGVTITAPLSEQAVARVFRKDASGGHIPGGGNHFEFGKRYIGSPVTLRINSEGARSLVNVDLGDGLQHPNTMIQSLANYLQSPLHGKIFKRLGADRDVAPEGNGDQVAIAQNGAGFTNVVQRFINQSSLPNDLVESKLLEELNKIFEPDAFFRNIRVRQHQSGSWEVFLEEQNKGAIALTHSGSGLKTVLLVLGFTILLPHIEGKLLSEYVFAFEELENNLHPSLQRRLVTYICKRALEERFVVFLTTHSSAVIDMLSHRNDAQIVHVTHSGQAAKARRVTTYVDNRGILDDLDIRASDLLQANGIVWVEGPSDRLYFNRWIGLVTGGALEEGAHYQCIFYGGRLLAHLSGTQPSDAESQEQVIRIFRVNRNAIVLMDSDKPNKDTKPNQTKSRIVQEVEALDGMAWITQGREVENYLPADALKRRFTEMTAFPEAFDDIANFLDQLSPGEGRRFERNKVMFAESMIPLIQRNDLTNCLDLEARALQASAEIARWNRIDVTWA